MSTFLKKPGFFRKEARFSSNSSSFNETSTASLRSSHSLFVSGCGLGMCCLPAECPLQTNSLATRARMKIAWSGAAEKRYFSDLLTARAYQQRFDLFAILRLQNWN